MGKRRSAGDHANKREPKADTGEDEYTAHTAEQRLEDLKKAGFKVTKYRQLKSSVQYKVLTPKPIRKLWPVIVIRDNMEEAIAYAEGVRGMWGAVQRKIKDETARTAKDFDLGVI